MIRKNIDIIAIAVLLAGVLLFGHARTLVLNGKNTVDRIAVTHAPCLFLQNL